MLELLPKKFGRYLLALFLKISMPDIQQDKKTFLVYHTLFTSPPRDIYFKKNYYSVIMNILTKKYMVWNKLEWGG